MLRLAIVDDDESELKKLDDLLDWRELGIVVIGCVTNVRDAYALIEDARADIVITDIQFPPQEENGIELIRKLRNTGRQIEFIAVTAYRKFEYALELMKYGIIDLFVKPVYGVQMEDAIKRAVKKLREADGVDNICRIVDYNDTKNGNFIAKAISYLDKHYKEKLTLGSVAANLYVSSWHLCKMFKKYTGKSFVDVLNLIRISKAREFLKNSRLKVNEIAKRVGFNDIAYFTVLFKRITGVTPLKYRNDASYKIRMDIDLKDDPLNGMSLPDEGYEATGEAVFCEGDEDDEDGYFKLRREICAKTEHHGTQRNEGAMLGEEDNKKMELEKENHSGGKWAL